MIDGTFAHRESYVVYTFFIGSKERKEIVVEGRYRDLERAHRHLKRLNLPVSAPRFPPKVFGLQTSTTRPKEVKKRLRHLVQYFNSLFQSPKYLEYFDQVADHFQVNPISREHLHTQAKIISEKHQQDMNQLEEYRQDELVHCQNYHKTELSLQLSRDIHLQILIQANGQAKILRCCDDALLFRAVTPDSSGRHWGDTKFTIQNADGVSLMELQEVCHYPQRYYNIFRISETPRPGEDQPICRIHQKFDLAEHQYRIEWVQSHLTCSGDVPLLCEGSWISTKMRFLLLDHVAAQVTPAPPQSWKALRKFRLCVSKQEDVILYIALCVCIERMHSEGEVW